ncbi:hypothetical protein [Streptomyces sp. HUAS TT7]|uniref:hypothetical protein n=1 Tax=Streptomyces sp. HUAS TT7 TaxID=3447507 RepID=UPI003F65D182
MLVLWLFLWGAMQSLVVTLVALALSVWARRRGAERAPAGGIGPEPALAAKALACED